MGNTHHIHQEADNSPQITTMLTQMAQMEEAIRGHNRTLTTEKHNLEVAIQKLKCQEQFNAHKGQLISQISQYLKNRRTQDIKEATRFDEIALRLAPNAELRHKAYLILSQREEIPYPTCDVVLASLMGSLVRWAKTPDMPSDKEQAKAPSITEGTLKKSQ